MDPFEKISKMIFLCFLALSVASPVLGVLNHETVQVKISQTAIDYSKFGYKISKSGKLTLTQKGTMVIGGIPNTTT